MFPSFTSASSWKSGLTWEKQLVCSIGKAYLIRHVKWPMSDFCARESEGRLKRLSLLLLIPEHCGDTRRAMGKFEKKKKNY